MLNLPGNVVSDLRHYVPKCLPRCSQMAPTWLPESSFESLPRSRGLRNVSKSIAMGTNSIESNWIVKFDLVRSNRIEFARIRPIDQTDSIESIAMGTKSDRIELDDRIRETSIESDRIRSNF